LLVKTCQLEFRRMVDPNLAQVPGAGFVSVRDGDGRFVGLKVSLPDYQCNKFRVKRLLFAANGREPIVDSGAAYPSRFRILANR
jgi:hypothetical protein